MWPASQNDDPWQRFGIDNLKRGIMSGIVLQSNDMVLDKDWYCLWVVRVMQNIISPEAPPTHLRHRGQSQNLSELGLLAQDWADCLP